MSASPRSALERLRHNVFDLVIANLSGRSRARLIVQPVQPLFDKTASPLAYRRVCRMKILRNGGAQFVVRTMEDHFRSECQMARATATSRQSSKSLALLLREYQFGLWPAYVCHTRSGSYRDMIYKVFLIQDTSSPVNNPRGVRCVNFARGQGAELKL